MFIMHEVFLQLTIIGMNNQIKPYKGFVPLD